MRKKLFVWTLTAALLLSLAVTACAVGEAPAAPAAEAASWYAEAVDYVRAQGLMDDTAPSAFSPDAAATRATLVTALYRQSGSPETASDADFSDVEEGAWYAAAVAWAAGNGMVDGHPDGRFAPADTVTREQFAAILWRQAGRPAPSGGAETFVDHGDISPYAVSAVAWAGEMSIFGGKEGGRFDPAGVTTRAETAVILYRLAAQTPPPVQGESRVLVAYFSHTGTTAGVAQTMAELTGGDLFGIVPATAYPADYGSCLEQARRELDADARPALSSHVEDMSRYDVVLLGFPIWHGNTPMAVRTFLEEYDLAGKTVAPFSTSGSGGIASAVGAVRDLCPGAEVPDGLSIPGADLGRAETLAAEWIGGLDLGGEEEVLPKLTVQVGTRSYSVTMEDSETTRAFLTRLPLTVSMGELNGNEKFYYLDSDLPADPDYPGGISSGDLMLYGRDCLVLFYKDFPTSYSYTRLGHMDDPDGLAAALGRGNVEVTFRVTEETA